jgi:hypothetical protein
MSLLEKLNKIYDAIDHIDKKGRNKSQGYDYIRSVDVTREIRKQFIEQKIYAEIDFDFVGLPYTIAREKAPNAPFAAVNVKCIATFHDLESKDVARGSGLGTGADLGDKAAYKAQTGALKYALKNSFLIPDEADPEADESTDAGSNDETQERGDMPDFAEASHEAPKKAESKKTVEKASRPTPAAALATVPAAVLLPPLNTSTTSENSESASATRTSAPASVPASAQSTPSSATADITLPNAAELTEFRKLFAKLGDVLSTDGKLKASKHLPINQKNLVFLLSITGAKDPKNITKAQWLDFFARVEKIKTLEGGMIALAKMVNERNGIEEK